ncbi:MAG TPA: thiamine phosphate synthase [Planctomycetaceae bacterium]|nr:thiamine phosphate synthase [Planctomycetaceae bacterium]
MFDDRLTEAARRALARSAALAAACGVSAREPLHLLWAVALDDSEAAETLQSRGVTREHLVRLCPLPLSLDIFDEETGIVSTEWPESADFRRVIAAATQAASLRGQAEVGTGDLLAALATVESDVSRTLAQLNADLRACTATDRTPQSPIDVDFQIDWRATSAEDQTATLRILDAAANRAREGLRVLEDFARFALDDPHLTRRLKECRHALREALSDLPIEGLLRSRETQSDVGTTISTPSEVSRQSPADVAWAAFKRAQEAVRTLEEFSKLVSPVAATRLERIRYELYTLEKGLALTEFNQRELADRRLYLLATEALCPQGLGPAVRSALAGGVDVVQLREKEMPERRLLALGRRVREWAREAGALFVVNDRPDLAVASDADGVHVGQDELPVKEARAIVGPHRLVGVSTHTIEQARQAVLDGADYLGIGPVFPSATKSFDSLAGLELVREVAAEISLPWFAIGGINAENISEVVRAGAQRIAVSNAILGAEDPASAAQTLADILCGLER